MHRLEQNRSSRTLLLAETMFLNKDLGTDSNGHYSLYHIDNLYLIGDVSF